MSLADVGDHSFDIRRDGASDYVQQPVDEIGLS